VPERFAIVGAGAVGLTLGARLARSGRDAVMLTRRPEQARRIARDGIRVEDPATGETWTQAVPARAEPDWDAEALRDRTAILCVRTPQLDAAAGALARIAPRALVANAQNDVDGDARLAARFPRVIGIVVRLTSTRLDDAAVRASGAGRLVVGEHPAGAGPETQRLAAALRAAGYLVAVSPRIAEDRWLKLCGNLMSAPNALIARPDHTTRAFVEIKARLLEEAARVLAAAGIEARPCDAGDRTLPEEIAYQRASLAAGTSARALPIYNQVWQALARGGPLEADLYHRRILALARRHGVPAPMNERVLEILLRQAGSGAGPESVRAAEMLID
jgi:2-dehydropantoate 2-reductase